MRTYAPLDEELFRPLMAEQHPLLVADADSTLVPEVYERLVNHLLDLHADQVTVLAALALPYRFHPSWNSLWPSDVLQILEGVRFLRSLHLAQLELGSQRDEMLRKMFMAFVRDLRVVLLYLALQSSRLELVSEGLEVSSPYFKRLAQLMLYILVPVVGRLGMYKLKHMVEEISFRFLSPLEYSQIVEEYQRHPELKEEVIRSLALRLQSFLAEHGLTVEVSGRMKSIYSTSTKMGRTTQHRLGLIHDLLALRVLTNTSLECYKAMGFIHGAFRMMPSRFKDYIAAPKVNGYQSLHLVALGMIEGSPESPVEIQIRTRDMHYEAEYGFAAHWQYREKPVKERGVAGPIVSRRDEKMEWLEYLAHARGIGKSAFGGLSMFSDRIFVFSVSGELVDLPKGSTPVDFAYSLGDEIGNTCSRAKVNDKVVSLDYELENGDKIFIFRKMDATPSPFWLSFVTTDLARERISSFLAYQRGRIPERTPVAEESAPSVDGSSVSHRILGDVYVSGLQNVNVRIASCCFPRKGHPVLGYVTRGGVVSLHKKECLALRALDRRRYVEVSWNAPAHRSLRRRIEVFSSRSGILLPLSSSLEREHAALVAFSRFHEAGRDRLVFDLEVREPSRAEAIADSWRDIEGIEGVHFV